MTESPLDLILVDVEYILYVVSQDFTGDAKTVLMELRKRLDQEVEMISTTKEAMIKHVDDAFVALRDHYDTKLASWHLESPRCHGGRGERPQRARCQINTNDLRIPTD
jgi:hypothetical protein